MKKKEAKGGKKPIGSAHQFEQDLPDIVKKYSIRVSKPYGCYPEDIANALQKLEDENNNLGKDNTALRDELDKTKKLYKEMQAEFTKFKMQVQLMRFDNSSLEEDEASIEEGMKEITSKKKPSIKLNTAKLTTTNSSKPSSGKSTFDNLISPKKKDGGNL